MESTSYVYPWQATHSSVLINLRSAKLAAIQAPKILDERFPKELTKEATYMIYVILAHVLLAVLGSSITVYEYFCKGNRKKNRFQRNNFAWLDDCKYFLKCFCLVKNGSKILKTDSTAKQNNTLHGLKSFFSFYITSIHVFQLYILSLKDVEKGKAFLKLRASQIFLSGSVSVEFFFVTSGFLNAYAFFHKYNTSNGNTFWIYFYLQRYVRITYTYMIVLGFYATLFTYTGTGSVWPDYNTNPVCKSGWWWNLLHINNFQERLKDCMDTWWYLAVDMQCYFISPLFIIPLKRWPRLGYTLIFACIGGSCVASFVLTYQHNISDGISRLEFYIDDHKDYIERFLIYVQTLHINPYIRISQYLVGILLGFYLQKKTSSRKVIRNSKLTLWCGWIASAISLCVSVFALHNREEILLETALFNSIKFLLSSCSFAWIIYVSITKQSKLLEACFSWKVFLPISRLSYCGYLVHVIFLFNLFLQTDDLMDFSIMFLISLCLYTIACTFVISFIVSMLFEMPANNFMDRLLKKKVKISNASNSHGKIVATNLSALKKIS